MAIELSAPPAADSTWRTHAGALAACGAALALALIGLAVLGAIGAANAPHDVGYATRQLRWLLLGAALAAAVARAPRRALERAAWPAYLAVLVALVVASVWGGGAHGVRRWLVLGRWAVQPSEFARLAVVLVTARALAQTAGAPDPRAARRRALATCALAALVPALLTARQPDLGTAVLMVATALAAAWPLLAALAPQPAPHAAPGAAYRDPAAHDEAPVPALAARPPTRAALVAAVVSLAAAALWLLAYAAPTLLLRPYQYARLRCVLEVWRGRGADACYQAHLVANVVSAGGVAGHGAGSYAREVGRALPGAATDLPLAAWAYEHGALGVALVLALYGALVAGALAVARRARDPFGVAVAAGVAALVLVPALVNTAMTLGLGPVVGIALPLVSYGGSSAVTTLLGVGLLAHVSRTT